MRWELAKRRSSDDWLARTARAWRQTGTGALRQRDPPLAQAPSADRPFACRAGRSARDLLGARRLRACAFATAEPTDQSLDHCGTAAERAVREQTYVWTLHPGRPPSRKQDTRTARRMRERAQPPTRRPLRHFRSERRRPGGSTGPDKDPGILTARYPAACSPTRHPSTLLETFVHVSPRKEPSCSPDPTPSPSSAPFPDER
jgi:hypothetical protein